MGYNGKNDIVECPECGEPMDEVWQSFCDSMSIHYLKIVS